MKKKGCFNDWFMIKDVFLQTIRGVSASTLRHGHYFTRGQVANEPVLKDFCEKVLKKIKASVNFGELGLYEEKAVLHFHGSIIGDVIVFYSDYDKFNDGFSV